VSIDGGRCGAAAMSPDGALVATWSEAEDGGIVQFWDTGPARISPMHPPLKDTQSGNLYGEIRFSADGGKISLASSRWMTVWDIQNGQEVAYDGSLDNSDWATDDTGDWDHHGDWIRYKGTYITKVPFESHLCARGSTAAFVEQATGRVHVLHLSGGPNEDQNEEDMVF